MTPELERHESSLRRRLNKLADLEEAAKKLVAVVKPAPGGGYVIDAASQQEYQDLLNILNGYR